MVRPGFRRTDEVSQQCPDCLIACIAEDVFGSWVPLHDAPARIEGDDGIESRGQKGARPRGGMEGREAGAKRGGGPATKSCTERQPARRFRPSMFFVTRS